MRFSPEIRRKFLQEQLDTVMELDNRETNAAIKEVLRWEAICCWCQGVKLTVKPNVYGAVTRLKLPTIGGFLVFVTKERVFSQVGGRRKE